MRISDWSSDVCSSDLIGGERPAARKRRMKPELPHEERRPQQPDKEQAEGNNDSATDEVQIVSVGEQQLSERSLTGTQKNEDGRDAAKEACAQPHCRQALRRPQYLQSANAVSIFTKN